MGANPVDHGKAAPITAQATPITEQSFRRLERNIFILIILVQLLGLLAFFVLVKLHAHTKGTRPAIQVEYISATPLNGNVSDDNPTSSVRWAVGVVVSNPNKRVHAIFHSFDMGLYYQGFLYLCSSQTGSFTIAPNSHKSLTAELEFRGGSAPSAIAGNLWRDGWAIANFDVSIHRTWVKFVLDPRHPNNFRDRQCWKPVDAVCKNIPVKFDANKIQSTVLQSNWCSIYYNGRC